MSNKIKIIVWGCNGRMGKVLCNLLEQNPDFEYTCGISKDSFCDISGDVIIDFSTPEATMEMLKFAVNSNTPAVIATTGFTTEQENLIFDASTKIPIFKSANMSFEIALFQSVLKQLSPKLSNADIEILETHHNKKIDAPSGTAKLLAKSINSELPEPKNIVYGREGKREKNEIGISSLRGGNIVGEHTVKFFSDFETLEITHTAYSRDIFAEGSLKAAKFLINQKPGLYGMDNLF